MKREETIAQVATAMGGGIGIIRISGARAHHIGRRLVNAGEEIEPRRAYLRPALAANGEALDQGLYLEFLAESSFTGEDVAEFQGHGGAIGLQRLLRRCLELGARAAEAGEFTLRAFLNGKMDLIEAEAIAETVAAQSEAAHRVAERQRQGELSSHLAEIRAPLLAAASRLQADIEFPDDNLGAFDSRAFGADVGVARAAIAKLRQGHKAGRLLRHGAVVALVGPTNAGKSSLMNALLGYERAIVSPLAGTTRDLVEDRFVVDGVPVRLVDTAGLRESGDVIEQAGMARTRQAMATAELVVVVVSDDSEWQSFDSCLADWRQKAEAAVAERQVLVVVNKADLGTRDKALEDWLADKAALFVSARTGRGVDELVIAIGRRLSGAELETPLVTLERHDRLLGESDEALARVERDLRSGVSSDCLLVDLDIAARRLGEVLGENVSEEVLSEIFKRFCIGK